MTLATLLLPFLQFLSILFFIVANLVLETFDFKFTLLYRLAEITEFSFSKTTFWQIMVLFLIFAFVFD